MLASSLRHRCNRLSVTLTYNRQLKTIRWNAEELIVMGWDMLLLSILFRCFVPLIVCLEKVNI